MKGTWILTRSASGFHSSDALYKTVIVTKKLKYILLFFVGVFKSYNIIQHLLQANMWLGTLLIERSDDIYRMKGLLSVDGMPERFVFQVCLDNSLVDCLLNTNVINFLLKLP